jgi:tetratricopeptide (TPR) repeat protein
LCSRNGHAVFDADLGDRVRLEYLAAVQPDSGDARELSVFVAGSKAAGLANGYSAEFFILDDFLQAYHAVLRLRQMAKRESAGPLDRSAVHRLAVERRGSRVQIAVDGETVVSFDDPAPLNGPDHTSFGVGSKCEHLHYDQLEVKVPLEDARRFVSDALARNDFARADLALTSVLEVERDAERLAAGRLLRARALLRLGRLAEAEASIQAVAAQRLEPSLDLERTLLVALLAAERGAPEDAFAALRRGPAIEGGRWPDAPERLRRAARSVLRRMDVIAGAERERVIRNQLAQPLTPFTVDLLDALASKPGLVLADVAPEHRPLVAPWFGRAAGAAAVSGAEAAAARLFTRGWYAHYLASVGLTSILEGAAAEAPGWFAQADAADALGGLVPIATFGRAVLDDRAGFRERLARSDLDQPEHLTWAARGWLVLGELHQAREAYEQVTARWGAQAQPAVMEARLMLRQLSEEQFSQAVRSPAYDFTLEYARTSSVVLGFARELRGEPTAAIEAYQASRGVRLPDLALRAAAERRLAQLAR